MKKNRFFLLLSTVSLLGGLLLLVLVGLVAGGAGQRALQDLEDLLVFNLLVGLEQRKVRGTGGGQTLDTVLGDGCGWLVPVRYTSNLDSRRTKSGQQTRDGSVVRVTSGLILSQHAVTHTLDHTDLGGLLVVELAQTEGELTELLDNLRQGRPGAGTLEDVGGGGPAVQGGTLRVVLDLTGAQRETNFDTPDFTDGGDTVTTNTVGGRDDDLLLTLDLVAREQPAGGVLNHIAAVGLGNLLEVGGDLGLRRRLLGSGLCLLLVRTAGEQTRGDHEAQHQLVSVVGCVNEVCLTARHLIVTLALSRNDDHITRNGTEAIDLGTELDLDDLTRLQSSFGLRRIGRQRSIGSNVGARGDGSWVSDTFQLAG